MPLFDIFSESKKKKKQEEKPRILIDFREKNSLVVSELKALNFEIEMQNLLVGDYIVKDVVIERKTVNDFISSMINKRLMKQLEELTQFEKKLLVIEGIDEQEVYSDKNEGVNANAVRGFLLTIVLKFKIPIIFTKDSEDTARFILLISRKKAKELSLNAKKKTLNKKERLQYIVEGFPGIGPKTAKKLLEKFGTIQNVVNASLDELKKVAGKKAEIFKELVEGEY